MPFAYDDSFVHGSYEIKKKRQGSSALTLFAFEFILGLEQFVGVFASLDE